MKYALTLNPISYGISNSVVPCCYKGPFKYYAIRRGGGGGVCQNMILYYTGGRGGKPKYDFIMRCRERGVADQI